MLAPPLGSDESEAMIGSVAILSSTERRRISREMSRLTARRRAQTSRLACSLRRPRQAVMETNTTAPANAISILSPMERENIDDIICTTISTESSKAM